jgi:hypothetical protein
MIRAYLIHLASLFVCACLLSITAPAHASHVNETRTTTSGQIYALLESLAMKRYRLVYAAQGSEEDIAALPQAEHLVMFNRMFLGAEFLGRPDIASDEAVSTYRVDLELAFLAESQTVPTEYAIRSMQVMTQERIAGSLLLNRVAILEHEMDPQVPITARTSWLMIFLQIRYAQVTWGTWDFATDQVAHLIMVVGLRELDHEIAENRRVSESGDVAAVRMRMDALLQQHFDMSNGLTTDARRLALEAAMVETEVLRSLIDRLESIVFDSGFENEASSH